MVNSIAESAYYARHFRLPGFTEKTQIELKRARVLIVGVGGLGCPVALYLAGAGVGTIGLCDADVVTVTNLHRQVLFDVHCLGQKKVDVAEARLRAMNPHIQFETYDAFADMKMLGSLVGKFDVVVDGTDNFDAKFAINDACEAAGIPLVYGSIFQFEGQVTVFHLKTEDFPRGVSYRDLYPEAPPAGLSMNCGEAGVIGVLPGIIGTLQANEVVKILTGIGKPLVGALLKFDALSSETRSLRLANRLAGSNERQQALPIASEITFEALAVMQDTDKPPTLIDVRDLAERALISLGGLHIALKELPTRLKEIPDNRAIVINCKSGMRSGMAALYLKSVLENCAIYSLQGGINGATCQLAAVQDGLVDE